MVIELQMELLNVDLGMKLSGVIMSELFLSSPLFWSIKGSNPRKYPLEESLCPNHLLFKTHIILRDIFKDTMKLRVPLCLFLPCFLFSVNLQNLSHNFWFA